MPVSGGIQAVNWMSVAAGMGAAGLADRGPGVLASLCLGERTCDRAETTQRAGRRGVRVDGRSACRTRSASRVLSRSSISTMTGGPATLGWIRPVILLPPATALGITPRQLEALLAHELAHIRRHDYLVNVLQMMAETVFFYHPAVWWASRRIRVERELCCDDIAIDVVR